MQNRVSLCEAIDTELILIIPLIGILLADVNTDKELRHQFAYHMR